MVIKLRRTSALARLPSWTILVAPVISTLGCSRATSRTSRWCFQPLRWLTVKGRQSRSRQSSVPRFKSCGAQDVGSANDAQACSRAKGVSTVISESRWTGPSSLRINSRHRSESTAVIAPNQPLENAVQVNRAN